MKLYVGTWNPAWGHTWVTRGFGHLYALRNLAEESSICVADDTANEDLIVCHPGGEGWEEFSYVGSNPCHITLLQKEAIVSDYSSGSLSICPLDEDGLPIQEPAMLYFEGQGPHLVRQNAPHIHSSWISPDGRSLLVVDLGTDKLYRFPVQDGKVAKEGIEAFFLPSGCGPRHCAFGDGVLYVATELSDEVLVLEWPSMTLKQRMIVNPTLPGGGAHIVLAGEYLYVSSRLKNDGIGIFRVLADGRLEKKAYLKTGRHPRHFCLSPDAQKVFVACRDDNKIQVFDRDLVSGALKPSGTEYPVSWPVYVEAV